MSLEPGFLRKPKYQFNRQFIISSLLLVVINALVWYYLLVLTKETFRFMTYGFTEFLLILSPRENYFYNWFYANIAIIIGLSIGIKFLVENSRKSKSPENRIARLFISSNQTTQTWTYVLWFTKVFVLFGAFAMGAPFMFFEIDFYGELRYLFIIFIIVWYFNLWLGIHKLRLRKSYCIPPILFIVVQIIAGSIAANNVIDVDKINENLLSGITTVKYEIDLPRLKNSKNTYKLPFSNFDVYLGWKKGKSSTQGNVIAKDHGDIYLSDGEIDGLRSYLEEEKGKWFVREASDYRLTLCADKSIRLATILEIKEIARQAGVGNIYYRTLPDNQEIPRKDYAQYWNSGYYEIISHDCSGVIEMIDSLERIGFRSRNLKFTKHECYRGIDIVNRNRFKITINEKQEIYINNLKVSEAELREFSYQFIKRYYGLVLCDYDDQISFDTYIKVQNLLKTVLYRIRKETALELFNLDYNSIRGPYPEDHYTKKQIVDLLYPNNIIELTETDKFLYEFSKK